MRISDGNITENTSEIKSFVRQFYTNLYSKTSPDEQARETILEGLPTLDPSDVEDCDSPLMPEVVENAVKLNNLTDLLAVLNESITRNAEICSPRKEISLIL